jgi:hypothetical protein
MVYDYRHELIELLNHTAGDPESLLQTQRSLTIIVDLLNQLQPQFKEPTSTEKQSAKPGYQIRRNVTVPKDLARPADQSDRGTNAQAA